MKFRSTITVVAMLFFASMPVLSQNNSMANSVANSMANSVTISASNFGLSKSGTRAETAGSMLLIEDDIFIGRAESGLPLQRGLSISSALSLWPDGIVPYEIDSGVSELGRSIVTEAINHWNDRSSITLIDRTATGNNSNDYVRFITGPGCASWVGRQGGVQEIWVSDYCTSGSMIHEAGHALGLLHEHTRSDRDQYIDVRWNNVQADKAFNFEISQSGTTDLGPYDYGSVMHYGEYFFSNNGEKTVVPINDIGDIEIGQRVAASQGDLDAIDRLYQTDLAISVAQFAGDDVSDIELTVSNLGNNGAHDLVISIAGSGVNTGFQSSAGWECFAAGTDLECALDRLAASAIASVTLSFASVVAVADISVALRSKTFDFNLDNNNGSATDGVVTAGPALGDDRNLPDTVTGSADYASLALLLLLLLNRRCVVIAFNHSIPGRSRHHAYSRIATPPCRTSW